jgi:hypothetical protein
MLGGYVARTDGGPSGQEFRSETELREYLRAKGVSEQQIAEAVKTLNSRSGSDRQITLFV